MKAGFRRRNPTCSQGLPQARKRLLAKRTPPPFLADSPVALAENRARTDRSAVRTHPMPELDAMISFGSSSQKSVKDKERMPTLRRPRPDPQSVGYCASCKNRASCGRRWSVHRSDSFNGHGLPSTRLPNIIPMSGGSSAISPRTTGKIAVSGGLVRTRTNDRPRIIYRELSRTSNGFLAARSRAFRCIHVAFLFCASCPNPADGFGLGD